MECNARWHIIYVMFSVIMISLSSGILGSRSYDPQSLDSLIHDHAIKAIAKQRTGSWSNVSLPANFSGIQASAIRLRTGSLWDRGTNISFLSIPPGVKPFPFAKRMVIIYHNLGNWSSLYFEVPGYKLVAPVVGFSIYHDDSKSRASGTDALRVSAMGDPILVTFPRVNVTEKGVSLKCVKLGPPGWYQFRKLINDSVCLTQVEGHFTIIAAPKKKKKKTWKWRVVGVAVFLGLILLGLICYSIYKLARSKTIRKMEGESDNAVALETTWVSTSRMPSAPMIRTQPAIEQGYAP